MCNCSHRWVIRWVAVGTAVPIRGLNSFGIWDRVARRIGSGITLIAHRAIWRCSVRNRNVLYISKVDVRLGNLVFRSHSGTIARCKHGNRVTGRDHGIGIGHNDIRQRGVSGVGHNDVIGKHIANRRNRVRLVLDNADGTALTKSNFRWIIGCHAYRI